MCTGFSRVSAACILPAELGTLMHDQGLLVPEAGSVPVPGSGVAVGRGSGRRFPL